MSETSSTSIAFVIPLYNERETLADLADAIAEHVGGRPYTILFVDDGSDDGSDVVLRELCETRAHVGCIRFRRNLGKTAALAAGFARVDADLVFTMDADLQDDPAEIPRFLEKLGEGYDVVTGWKQVRHDPGHKVIASRIYNGVIGRVFKLKLHDVNCGFKLLRREVVERLDLYGDRHRLIPVLATNLGYRVGEIAVQHHPRRYGRSKYGIERFIRGGLDTLAAWFLDRHSHSPGHFFAFLGFVLAAMGGLVLGAGVVVWLASTHVTAAIVLILAGCLGLQAALGAMGLALIGEFMLRHVARDNMDAYVSSFTPPRN